MMHAVPQADIALGGLLNGSLAAMRAKTHAIKTQLNAASLTIKVRRPMSHFLPGQAPVQWHAAVRVCIMHMLMPRTCLLRADVPGAAADGPPADQAGAVGGRGRAS